MEAISRFAPICWVNHRAIVEGLKAPESACWVNSYRQSPSHPPCSSIAVVILDQDLSRNFLK